MLLNSETILHVTYGSIRHAPRVIHSGRSAAESGYDVHVIGAPREPFAPQATNETIEGMQTYLIPLLTDVRPGTIWYVIRLWMKTELDTHTRPMPHGRNPLRTAINILIFNLWILRLGGQISPRLVHCHELWGLPASWLLARRRGVPVIYDVWDPLPYVEGTVKYRIVGSIEHFLARQSDAIIAASAFLQHQFENTVKGRNCLIANWKRLEDYDCLTAEQMQTKRIELGLREDALIVCYIGLLYRPRAILPRLEAVKVVEDIHLLIAGRGDYRSNVINAAHQDDRIHWLDWLPLEDVPLYTQVSDVVYLCFEDDPTAYRILPNKVFETFAAGKVMLARRDIGEMSEILEETGAGYLIDECTPDAIKQALEALKQPEVMRPLQANALAAREQYNWSLGEEILLMLYSKLLNDRSFRIDNSMPGEN